MIVFTVEKLKANGESYKRGNFACVYNTRRKARKVLGALERLYDKYKDRLRIRELELKPTKDK